MTNLGDFFSAAHQNKLNITPSAAGSFTGPNDTEFPIRLVTTPEELVATCETLSKHTELAFDLEFDDMRYFYGRTLSLVQVFDGLVNHLNFGVYIRRFYDLTNSFRYFIRSKRFE